MNTRILTIVSLIMAVAFVFSEVPHVGAANVSGTGAPGQLGGNGDHYNGGNTSSSNLSGSGGNNRPRTRQCYATLSGATLAGSSARSGSMSGFADIISRLTGTQSYQIVEGTPSVTLSWSNSAQRGDRGEEEDDSPRSGNGSAGGGDSGNTTSNGGTPATITRTLLSAPRTGGSDGNESGMGSGRNENLGRQTSPWTDTSVASLNLGSYRYSIRYSRGQITYRCTVNLDVISSNAPECSDGRDNDGDGFSDYEDPGCHTDGDPTNPDSYDPDDDSETHPLPNLRATLTLGNTSNLTTSSRLDSSASIQNDTTVWIPQNRGVLLMRKIGMPALCALGCVTAEGERYTIASSLTSPFGQNQSRSLSTSSSFTQGEGQYRICAVADIDNLVSESNETDNISCRTVTVARAPVVPPPGPTPTPPPTSSPGYTTISLGASPASIRRGNTSTLSWDTGGRAECTISGTNGHTISLGTRPTVSSEPTPAITSETLYTMSCTEDGATATAKIRIIPTYQEI